MTPLNDELRECLAEGRPDLLTLRDTSDPRDRALSLLQIHALHLAPVHELGHRVVLQHHPVLCEVKQRLETSLIHDLDHATAADVTTAPEDVREALLDIAVADRLPAVYRWLSQSATWSELVEFLTIEGGPDGGFDDLVALCQVGLSGEPKLELARNYWDEMGNGSLAQVHTVLHERLTQACGLGRTAPEQLPTEALERSVLNGLLATNRYLQPEFVGSLGMTELQAGPRCRLVVKALERLGAPADAFDFYTEHAEVDPRHGNDWVENAVKPLVAAHPDWGRRIVRGAAWRAWTNAQFFAAAVPGVIAA